MFQVLGQPADEVGHRGGAFEAEWRGGRAIAILVVAHHDSHAVELDRVEGIFVGDVVADVDRQHGARLRVVTAHNAL